MKKLFLVVFALVFCIPLFAGGVVNTLVPLTTLGAPGRITSDTLRVADARRVAFFLEYQDGAAPSDSVICQLTVEYSHDNSTWFAARFFDFVGGATFQTGETLTADTDYYFWLSDNNQSEYARVKLFGQGIDSTNIMTVETLAVQFK